MAIFEKHGFARKLLAWFVGKFFIMPYNKPDY